MRFLLGFFPNQVGVLSNNFIPVNEVISLFLSKSKNLYWDFFPTGFGFLPKKWAPTLQKFSHILLF